MWAQVSGQVVPRLAEGRREPGTPDRRDRSSEQPESTPGPCREGLGALSTENAGKHWPRRGGPEPTRSRCTPGGLCARSCEPEPRPPQPRLPGRPGPWFGSVDFARAFPPLGLGPVRHACRREAPARPGVHAALLLQRELHGLREVARVSVPCGSSRASSLDPACKAREPTGPSQAAFLPRVKVISAPRCHLSDRTCWPSSRTSPTGPRCTSASASCWARTESRGEAVAPAGLVELLLPRAVWLRLAATSPVRATALGPSCLLISTPPPPPRLPWDSGARQAACWGSPCPTRCRGAQKGGPVVGIAFLKCTVTWPKCPCSG